MLPFFSYSFLETYGMVDKTKSYKCLKEKFKQMNEETLAYFKRQLMDDLESLLKGVDCNFDGLDDSKDNTPDVIDKASNFIDRSLSQKICDRESLRIRKIEKALEDIDNGVYGICERCEEDIAIKRLKANPVANYCIHCKTEIEKRERLIGA